MRDLRAITHHQDQCACARSMGCFRQAVMNCAGFSAGFNQSGAAQRPQMLAQCGLADACYGFNLADGMAAIQKKREDHEALGLREEAKPFRESTAFFNRQDSHDERSEVVRRNHAGPASATSSCVWTGGLIVSFPGDQPSGVRTLLRSTS